MFARTIRREDGQVTAMVWVLAMLLAGAVATIGLTAGARHVKNTQTVGGVTIEEVMATATPQATPKPEETEPPVQHRTETIVETEAPAPPPAVVVVQSTPEATADCDEWDQEHGFCDGDSHNHTGP